MGEKYITIKVKYGIGYGEHATEIYVSPDATEDEINEDVENFIREKVWCSWEKEPSHD